MTMDRHVPGPIHFEQQQDQSPAVSVKILQPKRTDASMSAKERRDANGNQAIDEWTRLARTIKDDFDRKQKWHQELARHPCPDNVHRKPNIHKWDLCETLRLSVIRLKSDEAS
jgi:hypothetical protein